jgi:hypothetical protein
LRPVCVRGGFHRNLPRKEVIHPQLPLRMPCYDFVPITSPTLTPACAEALGIAGSLDVTGGEYKTRERIQRAVADARLLAIPASWSRVADSNPN